MGMELLSLFSDLRPKITVKNRSKESCDDAIRKAKEALLEKMHDVLDYYCGQISMLERFDMQLDHDDIEPLAFWSELMSYASIQFEEKTPLFQKYRGPNNFDCYCVLMNYDKMQLPWPDGYKDSASRVDGLAPMGLNDNFFFFAESNVLHQISFGTCSHEETKLEDGAIFNKRLEPVAKENYEIGKYITGVEYIRDSFQKLIRAKHGSNPADTLSVMEILDSFSKLLRARTGLQDYSLQILPTIDQTTTNFPQQFGIFKNDKQVYLEAFFDDLFF